MLSDPGLVKIDPGLSRRGIMYLMRSEKIHWRMLASEVSGNENFHASGRGGS